MNTKDSAPDRDIVPFLKEGKNVGIVLRSRTWPGFVRAPIVALLGFFEGAFSFNEWLKLSTSSPQERGAGLREKYYAYRNRRLAQEIGAFVRDGGIYVYGQKLFPCDGNFWELLDLVFQIIVLDQYEAEKFLKKDSVVIDAGANMGTFSVFAAHLAPEGKVFSFEPAEKTFATLAKNTAPYANVACVNAGLGAVATEKKIFIHANGTGANMFEDSVMAAGAKEGDGMWKPARITTIDGFVKERGIGRVDFIKMDTEGYEGNILQGARETIAKWKPVISMSAYHGVKDKDELPNLVREIDPTYKHKLVTIYEEDLVFYHE